MLKVENLPSYLSPSAIQNAIKMPHTFYLERLSGLPRFRVHEQDNAASTGSIFDFYIKENLIPTKFPDKMYMIPDLRKSIENTNSENFDRAKRIYHYYSTQIDTMGSLKDVELHVKKTIEGVPLFGKMDASVIYAGEEKDAPEGIYIGEIPLDFKYSTGAHKPGYFFRRQGFKASGAHEMYRPDLKLEEVDINWWIQGTIYGWLLGIPFGKPFYVRFDHIIEQTSDCSTAQYRLLASTKSQEQLMTIIKTVWQSMENGSYLDRLVSKYDLDLIWIMAKSETWF